MKKFLWLILPFLVACGGTVVEGDPNGFAPGHPPGMGPLTPGYFNQTPLFMTKWFVIMGFALAIIIVWWLTSKRVFEA
ncbi:hypothetical protein GWN42_06165, partial [candidate division KSB1 bacterium]|nr:hypothetical protein [candidate division KSB1 bacterium]